jgi:hypothetical protein
VRTLLAAAGGLALTALSFGAPLQTPAPRPSPKATPPLGPAPAVVPKPPPEMGQLQYFQGFWMCRGEVSASSRGSAHPTRTTVSINRDLGGMWLAGKVKEMQAPEGILPLEGMLHMAWDPGPKEYVLVWVDNAASYGTLRSAGWAGDVFEWSGAMTIAGQPVQVRDRLTRKGSTQVVHTSEANVDGAWVAVSEETCRKAGGSMRR